MRVFVPTPLRSYTRDQAEVEAAGETLGSALADLDRRFPGMRFRMIDEQDRIRPHIRFFVDGKPAVALAAPIPPGGVLQILCAISGGGA